MDLTVSNREQVFEISFASGRSEIKRRMALLIAMETNFNRTWL